MVGVATGQLAFVAGTVAAAGWLLLTPPRPAVEAGPSLRDEPAVAAVIRDEQPSLPVAPAEPVDKPMPGEVEISQPQGEWTGGIDPLRVQNIDVMDPDRKQYIEQLKSSALIEAIVHVTAPDGRVLPAVKFKGMDKPLFEGERVPNTEFRIRRIFENRVYKLGNERFVRSGVDVQGDTGAIITLFLPDNH